MVLQVEPRTQRTKTMKSSNDPIKKLAVQTRQKRQLQCSDIKETNDASSWIGFGSPPKCTDAALSAAIQISNEDLQCYLPPHIHMNTHMRKRLEDDSARSSQTTDTAPSSPESSISKNVLETPSKKTGKIVLTTTPTSKRNRHNCKSLALPLPLLNTSTSTASTLSTSSHHSRSRANAGIVQVQESSEERTATATAPRRRFKGEAVEAAKRRLSAGAVEATKSTARLRERSSERRRNSASAISRDRSLDRSSRSRGRRDQDHPVSLQHQEHLNRNINNNMYQDEPTEDEKNCFASPKTTTTPLDGWQLREQVKTKKLPHSIATAPITTEDSSKSTILLDDKTLSKEERRKARRAKKKDADEEALACARSTGLDVKYKKPRRKARCSASKSTCMVEGVSVQNCKQQKEHSSKASRKEQKQEAQESSQSPVIPKAPTLAAWQLREQIKKSPTPIQARKRHNFKKEEEPPKEEPSNRDAPPVKPQRKNPKEEEREERRKSRSSRTSVAQKELESKSQDELPSGFAVALKKTSKADKPKNDQQKTLKGEMRRKSRISSIRVPVTKTELQSKPQDELLSGLTFALKQASKTNEEDTPKDEDESNKEERRKSRKVRASLGTKKELKTNPQNNLPSGLASSRDASEKVPAVKSPATPRSSKWAKIKASNHFIISTKKQAENTRRSRGQNEPQLPKDENEEGMGARSHPFASVPQSPMSRRSQPVAAWQLREQAKKKGSLGGLNRSSHHSAHRSVQSKSPAAALPPAFRSILTPPRSAIQQRTKKYLTTNAAKRQQKSESAVRRSSILDSMSDFLEPHETDRQKMMSVGKVEISDGKKRIVFELGGATSLPEGTRIPLIPDLV